MKKRLKTLFNKILLVFVASGLACSGVFISTFEYVIPIDTTLEVLEKIMAVFLLIAALYILIFFNQILKTLEL